MKKNKKKEPVIQKLMIVLSNPLHVFLDLLHVKQTILQYRATEA